MLVCSYVSCSLLFYYNTCRYEYSSKLGDLQLHVVAFAASTSVTEEYANAVAIGRETDVISLSDEEGNEDVKTGTEFALLEQVSIVMTQCVQIRKIHSSV